MWVRAERVVQAVDCVFCYLVDGKARIVGAVPSRYVYVDGSSVGEITEAELKDRRILGEEGFISIFAAVDSATGAGVAGPHIQARGMAEDESVFDAILPRVAAELTSAARGGTAGAHQVQRVMRGVVGGWASSRLRRRPMIIPVVVEA